jgi:predicted GIY-YIG superfamily endonuclease
MSKARTSGHNVVIQGPGIKKLDKMSFVDGAIQHLAEKSTALQAERQQVKPDWAKSKEDLLEEKSAAEKSTSAQSEKDSDSS